MYGEDSAQSLDTTEALASTSHLKGSLAEAAEIRKSILDSVLSRDDDPMARVKACGAYGNTLLKQWNLDESKHNLVQAVESSKAAVGSEDPVTLGY